MIPASFEYHRPSTLPEAVALLGRLGDDAKVLAGGQSLIPLMKLRLASPRHVVDINRIAGLGTIAEKDGALVIGALVRESDLEASDLVRRRFPILADADRKVATLYDMIHPEANDTVTVRSVFVIDEHKKIRTIITYPASTGRNFEEILRVIDSLQLTDDHKVATPVDWKLGDDVVILPSLQDPKELARLFPALTHGGLGTVPPIAGHEADSERWRLFEAITRLLAELAADRTVVVVLDDLHWADRSTMSLLRHVLRTSQEAPLAFVLTARGAEASKDAPMHEVLRQLRVEPPPLGYDGRLLALPADVERLAPGERRRLEARLRFKRRGAHQLAPFRVAQLLPLELAQGAASKSDAASFLVVPRVARVTAVGAARSRRPQPAGLAGASRVAEALDLAGVRPYRTGDALRAPSFTARAMAAFYQMLLAGGTLNGRRLLSPRTLAYVLRNYTGDRVDGYMGLPMHRGLGPHLRGTTETIRGLGSLASPRTFGHGGVGSSYCWADPDSGVSFAYLTNNRVPDPWHSERMDRISNAMHAAID